MHKTTVCKQIQKTIVDALSSDKAWTTAATLLIRMNTGLDKVGERLVRAIDEGRYGDVFFVISETGYISPEIVSAIRKALLPGPILCDLWYEQTLAVRVLGMIGDPEESCSYLREVIRHGAFPHVRIEAIRTIRKLHRHNLDDVGAVLDAMEHDSEAEVRVCAAVTLVNWGIFAESAVDELIEQTGEVPDVLLAAAEEFVAVGRTDRASRILLGLLTTSRHLCPQVVVIDAVKLAGKLGTEYAADFAPILRELAENETDWETSIAAVRALGHLQCRDRETVALLRKMSTQDGDEWKRVWALNTLLLLGKAKKSDLTILGKTDDWKCYIALHGITQDNLSKEMLTTITERLRKSTNLGAVPPCKSILFHLGDVADSDFDDLLRRALLLGINESTLIAMSDLWFAIGCNPE